ncbi:MAG: DUF6164 family protein [Pseudomonadota bacterium]|nr:DUF6164 family protein [Pseudomonadota bacterium]
MAKLLFKLNGVTQEEADFVRASLDKAGVIYYETDQGRWGISLAAIWLPNEDDYMSARTLLDEIQEDWREQVQHHPTQTLGERFRERPVSFLLGLIGAGAIIGLSVLPFLGAFD